MWVGCLWLTTLRRSVTANVGPKCWIYPASFQPTSLCNHIWHKLYSRWGHAFFPFSLHMHANCFHKDVPYDVFTLGLLIFRWGCLSFMSDECRTILGSQQISVFIWHSLGKKIQHTAEVGKICHSFWGTKPRETIQLATDQWQDRPWDLLSNYEKA